MTEISHHAVKLLIPRYWP